MNSAERLEKGLAFLRSHEWGQTADRQECEGSPDGFAYCARGALIYGGFADMSPEYCLENCEYHKGPCVLDELGDCVNFDRHPIDREYRRALRYLDDVAREASGKAFWTSTALYNDALYRTKEDIESLFEKAIARARKTVDEDV